jgi:sugar O-acyltransferase (sialic acid O-acetyltransferase NeuD family)
MKKTKKEKLIIFGNGKLAELAYFYFSRDSNYQPIAFTLDTNYITNKTFLNLPVVSFDHIQKKYPVEDHTMFIAVGYKKLNAIRMKKYFEAKEKGYRLASYISSAIKFWEDPIIGDNCFLLENQIIQPNVRIGSNNIIWGGNHFGHDVVINSHCFIASHVVLSGGVEVKDQNFIGINVSVRDNVKIAEKCIIGAGSIILKNTKKNEVYYGASAQKYPLSSDKFMAIMDISRNL